MYQGGNGGDRAVEDLDKLTADTRTRLADQTGAIGLGAELVSEPLPEGIGERAD
jgi:hypothetical protein